jgi:hypothetical protein
MEPKDAASAKRPSSRGFGVLIGDAASKTQGMPSPGAVNTDNLVTPASAAALTSSLGDLAKPLAGVQSVTGARSEVRWMWRPLLVADLVLVCVAAWILIEPGLRAQRGSVLLGCLLMGVAGILGVLSSRLSR